ncbi:beta-fructofuranosidase 1-like [Canna indica]|uniref:Beta-fructofuranosidase 1-like n=1 Tax=Canna indica TaxID=4628 RepID=A0AAQ3KSN8_9LILI|nr:beta-fructofuranosidase 1-like [Canna indica]
MDQTLPLHRSPLISAPNSSAARRRLPILAISLAALFLAGVVVVAVIVGGGDSQDRTTLPPGDASAISSRGPADGVSEKTSGARVLFLAGQEESSSFQWTNDMLDWQRTAFHFQPLNNWMNDPNAPLFYKGWYHLFYQYNPSGAVWGNITWGHAVSRDLVRWFHLPLALFPDQWYDSNGAWTGSATVLPSDGRLVVLYTGSTNESVQVQNLVVPADPNDSLLLRWSKSDANPVLLPPAGVAPYDFRDPTTAWIDSEGFWRVAIGTKDDAHAGIAIVYRTADFLNYELLPGVLHRVVGTGMWECVDFYPVATGGNAMGEGLDASVPAGNGVKHVLKASMDDDRHDYYAIGSYDLEKNAWVPDNPEADVGIGLRYDWGKFYASKTFFDPAKQRRVLWGWVGETDSEAADVKKGWASLQAIPRTVVFDVKTGSNLIQWPVEEVESLRMSSRKYGNIKLVPGSIFPLDVVGMATQLDIVAEFEIDPVALTATVEADVGYNCSTSGGAAARGMLGPFGLLVLADEGLSEQTAVYFYIAKGTDGQLTTHFCHDETRSSRANDIVKRVVGSRVPVLDGEKLSVRILVDHSIVESFGQKGRACITSRVYPTRAIYSAARVFLFNNASSANVITKSITTWQMNSTFNHPFNFQ